MRLGPRSHRTRRSKESLFRCR